MPRIRRSAVNRDVLRLAVVLSLFVAAVCRAADAGDSRLHITYPLEGTLFPPDSVAPTFLWEVPAGTDNHWAIEVRDDRGAALLKAAVDTPRWRPSEEDWRRIKHESSEGNAEVIVS